MVSNEPSKGDGRELNRAWWSALLLQRHSPIRQRFLNACARLAKLGRPFRRRLWRKTAGAAGGLALVLALAGSPLFIPNAHAAVITVDETTCTLVDAILAAENDTAVGGCVPGSGADTIALATDVLLTAPYLYADGLPRVTTPITIDGNGHTIARDSGALRFRLFTVDASGDLTLNEVTLSGAFYGAIFLDGGVLAINDSQITGNRTDYFGGGGVYGRNGAITIANSTINNNWSVDKEGGGVRAVDSTVTIDNSIISQNSSNDGDGGGLAASGGSVSITNSTINNNTAYGGGGGLFLVLGSATISGSTISGNTAANGMGGGLVAIGQTLLLTNSTVSSNEADDRGGGLSISDTSATLTDVNVTDNTSIGGGGIFFYDYPYYTSNYTLNINGGTISNNTATVDAGGVYVKYGSVAISGSTISGNAAGFNIGGVKTYYSDVSVDNTSIEGNSATYSAGGLYVVGGALELTANTISGNTAGAATGGVGLYGVTADIANTTVSGNSAQYFGGGFRILDGATTLTNVTVTGNTAQLHAGGLYLQDANMTFAQSLISGNSAPNGDEIFIANYFGSPTLTTDASLFGHSGQTAAEAFVDFTPGLTDLTATSDGTHPTALATILDPALADNGGPTLTHALPPGSPAIDLAPAGPATDQRGLPRPFGPGFDVGAFELQPPDDDVDGVTDAVEDGAPNNGDGNDDGTPDSEQANVASLPDSEDGDYVTLAAPAGVELVDVAAIDNPSPGDAPTGVGFPIGFLSFSLQGFAPGSAVPVTIFLHGGETVDAYYKYGPTTGNPADHWYPFLYDGATGAELLSDRIVLHLVDGERGDADLAADGVIVDPGAPALEPAAAGTLYVAGVSDGSAGGVAFDHHDILAFDTGTETWAMHFDGSDVGVGKALSAFSILEDGSLVMAFKAKLNLPGLGKVMPHDLVRFVPSSLGTTTSGVFEWYLDGSDIGLTKSGERIDAVDVLPDGRILISSTGGVKVGPGNSVVAAKQDLLALTPGILGSNSSGSWAQYFDGSTVAGLASENVVGAAIDVASGEIYLTIANGFNVGGVSGGAKDVLRLEPDGGGGFTVHQFWNGPANGFLPTLGGIELGD